MSAGRGVRNGLIISFPVWAAIALIVALVVNR